jgi:CDP-diglyceride synthetase
MVERIIRGMAGFMVLATLLLAYYHSRYWLWVTAFVGANLLQSSMTGWCPAMAFLRKIGVKD